MSKSAKSPAILAGCGCLSLVIAAILFAGAYYVSSHHAAGEMVHYKNSPQGRSGNLAENYVGFELDYPKSWKVKDDPQNFVSVERSVDGNTWENLNVGYFQTAGSSERNEALYGQLISQLQNQFAQQFADLEKVSEGKTTIASYEGYEGRFHATLKAGEKNADVYIRAVLLPTPDAKKGVSLLMMGTSFSPDLHSAADLGEKGELPAVLETFKFD